MPNIRFTAPPGRGIFQRIVAVFCLVAAIANLAFSKWLVSSCLLRLG
jgi:hypothetical protein